MPLQDPRAGRTPTKHTDMWPQRDEQADIAYVQSASKLHSEDESRPDRVGVRDRSIGRVGRALRFLRKRGLMEVFLLIRRHGVRESWRFILRNIRLIIAARADRRFDRQHRVDTAGTIPLEFLSLVGSNLEYATEYVPTSPKSFAWMMRHIKGDLGSFVFIDFGAGKGRTLLLAAQYSFSRVLGVEFAEELVAAAQQNFQSYRSGAERRAQTEIIHADATQFRFPDSPLVLYFYNPFGPEVFQQVLNNLVESLNIYPRPCFIIYASSFQDTLPWVRTLIGATSKFKEVNTTAMPMFLDAVRSLDFAVFSNRTPDHLDYSP